MAKVFIEEQTLTDIADAVRGKNGTTEPIRTIELATAITNLPTGGGENKLQQYFEKTLTELKPEDMGNAVDVTLLYTMFDGQINLKSVDLPEVISADAYCFQNCTSLENVNLPKLATIGDYCFTGCNNLNTTILPELTSLPRRCFVKAGKAGSKLILPKLQTATQWAINHSGVGCGFSLIDFGTCLKLETQVFGACANLQAVVLRRTDDICTTSAPFTTYPNTTCAIYVPALNDNDEDMVAIYQAATNWTATANRIKPFYIAETVEDITTLLADENIAVGSMIICDVNHSYTIKGGNTL